MPNAALSPILWQVGHLAVVDGSLARRAGGASSGSLPGNFPDLFKTGTGGMAQYPPLDIVVQVFDGMHETLLRVVAETELDSPDASTRGLRTTRGKMLGFVNGHRWYYAHGGAGMTRDASDGWAYPIYSALYGRAFV